MKYFTAFFNDENRYVGNAAAVKRLLWRHPEIKTVERVHVFRGDTVDCEEFTRDEILGTKSAELSKGQTAQWAQEHGTL